MPPASGYAIEGLSKSVTIIPPNSDAREREPPSYRPTVSGSLKLIFNRAADGVFEQVDSLGVETHQGGEAKIIGFPA